MVLTDPIETKGTVVRTYTASVVGGGSGGRLSLNALHASGRYELVALADLRQDVCDELAQKFACVRTFTSHEDMFAQCPTDVVCVSTWPPSHHPITLDALKLPLKGILVEKPLGDTARAGRELLDAIKHKGLPVAVPHGLLALRHSREILARVHRGEIGDLKLVEIQCTRWDIINAGIHWLNFFVNLVRCEPMDYVLAACDASTRTYRDGMQVETIAVTYAQTKSGVRVVMNTGDQVNVNREGKSTLFRLVGTKGMIEFWAWEGAYLLTNAAHPNGKLHQVPPAAQSHHQVHLDAMAEQMDAGQQDYAIAESSLMALELCEAAYVSNRHRCKVTLPLSEFSPPAAVRWDPGMPYSGEGGGRDGRKL